MIEGYRYVENSGKSALVRGEEHDELLAALIHGRGLTPDNTSGRGAVYRFTCAGGAGIVREYHRGGLIRHVNRRAYLTNRPLRELRVTDYLWREGFPGPEPLGICWWRRLGLVFGRIATKALDARNLQHYLQEETHPSVEVLRRTGETIRRLHEAGVYHADLQVRNLLVTEEMTHIIDFDKAWGPGTVSPRSRAMNLLRLRRSFEKNGLDLRWYDEIAEGYGVTQGFHLLATFYRVKSALTRSTPRK